MKKFLLFLLALTPVAQAQVITTDLELRNPASLGGERFANGALTSGTSWSVSGDFALTGGQAVYTDSTHMGTLTQTSANATLPWANTGIGVWFSFTYTVTVLEGAPTCTIPATFAAVAQSILNPASRQAPWTNTLVFQALGTTVGDFAITCTSPAAARVSLDNLSLKHIIGGNLTINGSLQPKGTFLLSHSTQGAIPKALTDAGAAVPFATVAVPTNGWIAGELEWAATSLSGANQLVANGHIRFWGSDTAGTPVCGVNKIGTDGEGHSGGANTLVCTWTNVVSTTNCAVSVTCTNDLAAAQAITLYGRVDMPLLSTIVYP